jgi:hypothetical protein
VENIFPEVTLALETGRYRVPGKVVASSVARFAALHKREPFSSAGDLALLGVG